MSLILLEGLDRTGKSSVAKKFEEEGYEIIHLSAPSRHYTQQGYTGPSYLDDMIELIQQASTRNIVLDRTHYGELIWPYIYNRDPLLSEEDIEILREIEEVVGTRRILMCDPDYEAHWQRCVKNNEPLTRPQFMRARTMYDRMANQYNFEKLVLSELPWFLNDVANLNVNSKANITNLNKDLIKKTKEQIKLEKANAINDILSKRIVRGKTPIYDEIEKEVRDFLNKKLGTILGSDDKDSFSSEEMMVLRAFIKRLKEKGNQ